MMIASNLARTITRVVSKAEARLAHGYLSRCILYVTKHMSLISIGDITEITNSTLATYPQFPRSFVHC